MKSIIASLAGLACLLGVFGGHMQQSLAMEAQVDAKQKLAADYFEALTAADMDSADALVTVPYSLDRKKVLTTIDEVKEVHQKIAKDKGKREIPQYTIALTNEAPKLDETQFPKYVAYRIAVSVPGRERKENIDIYVTDTDTDTPRVIGFSD